MSTAGLSVPSDGTQNGVDWRLLVEECIAIITKLTNLLFFGMLGHPKRLKGICIFFGLFGISATDFHCYK